MLSFGAYREVLAMVSYLYNNLQHYQNLILLITLFDTRIHSYQDGAIPISECCCHECSL